MVLTRCPARGFCALPGYSVLLKASIEQTTECHRRIRGETRLLFCVSFRARSSLQFDDCSGSARSVALRAFGIICPSPFDEFRRHRIVENARADKILVVDAVILSEVFAIERALKCPR